LHVAGSRLSPCRQLIKFSLANSFVFVAFFLVPIAIPGLLVIASWTGVWLAAALCALIAWPIFLRPV